MAYAVITERYEAGFGIYGYGQLTDSALNDRRQQQAPQKRRLDGDVYDQLYDRIRSGLYPLGGKLPSETELAIEFGVSRPIVRTALARLRDTRLIVSRRGSGSYVSDGVAVEGEAFSPLSSVEDIDRLYAFRRLVEQEAAGLAARHTSPGKLKRLASLAAKMEKMSTKDSDKLDVDMEFHGLIAEMSGNRFLAETIHMMRPHLHFIRRFVQSLSNAGHNARKIEMNTEHRNIIAALERGDPEKARAAMRAHIDGSQRRVFKGD